MQLPEFVFINSKDLAGGEYILSTRPPYYVLRAYRFEDPQSFENFIVKNNILNDCVEVPGYNILVAYIGTIEQVSLSPILGHNVPRELINNFTNLLNFYEKERIKGNESRLKKYRKI